MKIKAYRNLRNGMWSILDSKDKLLFYVESVKIKNVKFVVRPGGNKRARLEKQKNVHAFVIGELVDFDKNFRVSNFKWGTYCPYKFDKFVDRNNKEINEAEFVILTKSKELYFKN